MSEKGFDVNQYIPINWGWLKMLGILGMVTLWLVGAVLLLNDLRMPNRHPLVLLVDAIVGGALVVGSICAGKAWTFTQDYWHRNVRGEVANFTLVGDEVVVWNCRNLSECGWQVSSLVWRLPLGGWFKGDSKLLTFCDWWVEADWSFRQVYMFLQKNPARFRVRLVDGYGNALEAFLSDAFRYVNNCANKDFRTMFEDFDRLSKEVSADDAVGAQISALLDSFPERHRRFANSENGKAFLAELREVLSPLTSRIM